MTRVGDVLDGIVCGDSIWPGLLVVTGLVAALVTVIIVPLLLTGALDSSTTVCPPGHSIVETPMLVGKALVMVPRCV